MPKVYLLKKLIEALERNEGKDNFFHDDFHDKQ